MIGIKIIVVVVMIISVYGDEELFLINRLYEEEMEEIISCGYRFWNNSIIKVIIVNLLEMKVIFCWLVIILMWVIMEKVMIKIR